MRVAARMLLGMCALALVGCSGGSESDEPEPLPPPTGEDGRHHLADKPLKTFPDKKSDRWRTEEAMKKAEERANAYKYAHKIEPQPTSADPMKGKPFGLEQALAGIDGTGPVKAVFDTTEGEFVCTLDTEGSPIAAAHFIGLARGLRAWWDSAKAQWSTAPLYTDIPVYKVVSGEAFFSGCPMSVGFAEVGFRSVMPQGVLDRPDEPYELALLTHARVPSFGPQFLITAKGDPKFEEMAHVFGHCEGAGPIQKIAGKDVSKSGHPIDDVLVRRVKITR
ncbi:MAG: peptidylprolyl isomerase [Deltaproteobacteria bacterium]|nr:peptidylprolyl isomerase [Deltaproteobacteria bacterium]